MNAGQVFKTEFAKLLGMLRKRGNPREDAEDLVQEAFVRLLSYIEKGGKVAEPEAFLANEIDRYIVYPGQALTYLIGKRELLRLRAEAEHQLGSGFALADFHAAVLDNGSLPMPVLEDKIRRWVASASAR